MNPSEKIIEQREDILGGTHVFKGIRVPVKTFFEYLKADHSIQEFLENFPTVSLRQAIEVLDSLKEQLLQPQ